MWCLLLSPCCPGLLLLFGVSSGFMRILGLFSLSVRHSLGILIGILLNLYVSFGEWLFWHYWFVPIQNREYLSIFWCSLWFFFFLKTTMVFVIEVFHFIIRLIPNHFNFSWSCCKWYCLPNYFLLQILIFIESICL